jgi:undecaprenyl-diphosphatase
VKLTLDFTLPFGSSLKVLDGWSSFPSDHAVLLFTLITGVFLISKRLGVFVLLYSVIIALIPRIYLGLHYPTDIIAGAILGVSITIIFNREYFIDKFSKPILELSNSKPEIFYPIFFLISFQASDLFEGFRAVASMLKEGLKLIL